MSTFDGFVKEFPAIRIDHFRSDPARPKPAACFLSHVHSDHLLGLESLKMPFVYCSATTRRLLLRIEKYPHRVNFAKGILESRKQHYRHLKTIMRALPLQAATEIELSPKARIRVTLFDANHCPGAVMFLIEGDGKAILYTGDVRAEPWWVNSIVQNPILLPYACGMRRLDCIYLDTTFATHDDNFRHFPTKAEGLRELITKVAECPEDSIFYFRAWTLGYEQVWIALTNLLQCNVHVDDYQMRLFGSIVENGNDGYSMFEGPSLVGFQVGNRSQPGILTSSRDTRVHSCEPGLPCHNSLQEQNIVWITPIISRMRDGTELREIGAGGGGGDLYQTQELELTDELQEAIRRELAGNESALKQVAEIFESAKISGSSTISLDGLGLDNGTELSLKDFVKLVSQHGDWRGKKNADDSVANKRQRIIHFPYSRHSSYEELRHLISALQPKDLCPCTVDLASWSEEVSMKALFGDLCAELRFEHDVLVRTKALAFQKEQEATNLKRKRQEESQENATEESDNFPLVDSRAEGGVTVNIEGIKTAFRKLNGGSDLIVNDAQTLEGTETNGQVESQASLTSSAFESQQADVLPRADHVPAERIWADVSNSTQSGLRKSTRREAYRMARRSMKSSDSSGWDDISLRSVGRSGHVHDEPEL
ncbi:uncharacterized protein HMPREF1541_09172 [Cyphellophora europaea CBS 101466]|uniref:Protein artemis n=1 Tax=Cyphellophora europaea (strain CBS 101466) TaxID=1220924 RepID=W2S9E2_CYPE1|nr:uncharacterized protein HMPREF1541_09172 [Cyphellophora europaea CBS 101466]ETN45341.1 hypothetical protein HMPREF1541_09172 [Cyphellophora europaea CBS 101466]